MDGKLSNTAPTECCCVRAPPPAERPELARALFGGSDGPEAETSAPVAALGGSSTGRLGAPPEPAKSVPLAANEPPTPPAGALGASPELAESVSLTADETPAGPVVLLGASPEPANSVPLAANEPPMAPAVVLGETPLTPEPTQLALPDCQKDLGRGALALTPCEAPGGCEAPAGCDAPCRAPAAP